MKKVILSIAIVAGIIIATTNMQTVQAGERSIVNTVLDDDGFVKVNIEDLTEQVQQAVNAFTEEYDVKALKHNAEKQLTKVKLTKKDDQSEKTVYLDNEGKEVSLDSEQIKTEEIETQLPMW